MQKDIKRKKERIMPLVSVHDVLTHATENHYGVAAINVANYETIK